MKEYIDLLDREFDRCKKLDQKLEKENHGSPSAYSLYFTGICDVVSEIKEKFISLQQKNREKAEEYLSDYSNKTNLITYDAKEKDLLRQSAREIKNHLIKIGII